jgi:hypothetical protein
MSKIGDDKDQRCAPNKTFEDGSCIPLYLLVEMANAYNNDDQTGKDNNIKLNPGLETLNPKKYKSYLLGEFSKRLDKVCDDQRCWIKQNFVKRMNKRMAQELSKKTFRPQGPEGKFTWLNTFNINDVMGQYEDKYKDFVFLGAVPIDFDDLPDLGLKNFNFVDSINKGKSKIGVIFNLDEHYKGGSHWVSMFCDLNKGFVYFFDSYGTEPEPRIRKFMRKAARCLKEDINKKPIVDHNRTRHQYGNSECGVYSINFILRMLDGDTFENICNNKLSDEDVNKCRSIYFT